MKKQMGDPALRELDWKNPLQQVSVSLVRLGYKTEKNRRESEAPQKVVRARKGEIISPTTLRSCAYTKFENIYKVLRRGQIHAPELY